MAVTSVGARLGLWRNVRIQRFLAQAAFVGLLGAFAYYLVDRARDLELGFEFLNGHMGLSLNDHPHQFEVGGRELRTWCAWDTLFLPPMLGQTAYVVPRDPPTRGRGHLSG